MDDTELGESQGSGIWPWNSAYRLVLRAIFVFDTEGYTSKKRTIKKLRKQAMYKSCSRRAYV